MFGTWIILLYLTTDLKAWILSGDVCYENAEIKAYSSNLTNVTWCDNIFVSNGTNALHSNGTRIQLSGDFVALDVVEGYLMGIVKTATANSSYQFWNERLNLYQPLPDLSKTILGVSAWNPTTRTYWTIGYPKSNNYISMYSVNTVTNATRFYLIATGETPVNLLWNGNELVAIVVKTQTYYTVPFLRGSRKYFLGAATGVWLIVSKSTNEALLSPQIPGYSLICSFECHSTSPDISYLPFPSERAPSPISVLPFQSRSTGAIPPRPTPTPVRIPTPTPTSTPTPTPAGVPIPSPTPVRVYNPTPSPTPVVTPGVFESSSAEPSPTPTPLTSTTTTTTTVTEINDTVTFSPVILRPIVYLEWGVDVSSSPIPYTEVVVLEGTLVIPPRSRLTLDFSQDRPADGDTFILFYYSDVQGVYSGVDIVGQTCFQYDTQVNYEKNYLSVTIKSLTSTCVAQKLVAW